MLEIPIFHSDHKKSTLTSCVRTWRGPRPRRCSGRHPSPTKTSVLGKWTSRRPTSFWNQFNKSLWKARSFDRNNFLFPYGRFLALYNRSNYHTWCILDILKLIKSKKKLLNNIIFACSHFGNPGNSTFCNSKKALLSFFRLVFRFYHVDYFLVYVFRLFICFPNINKTLILSIPILNDALIHFACKHSVYI